MKKYKILSSHLIELEPFEERILNLDSEVVIMPQQAAKVFVHWYSKNNKLAATFTLNDSTLCSCPCKIINGENEKTVLHVIEL